MTPIEIIPIARAGYLYTVEYFQDFDTESPRESSTQTLMMVYDERRHLTVNEVQDSTDPAAAALLRFLATFEPSDPDRVERAFALWRALSGSSTQLFTGTPGGNNSFRYYALAESEEIVDSEVSAYGQWRNGEVFGYVLTGPDGGEVESCWGFYDDAGARWYWELALRTDWLVRVQSAAVDRRELRRQARSEGAGFVGVI
ncbi:hypothetical protein [Nocardia carnea]|uniref:hypothetical protein n=1 Tax=Nocardia carnea TaxID=37328 RepID=UPI002456CD9E|nr:hypothetical protein [Nocardia carnea]